MIIVAIVYFLVIPKIKPMCASPSKCANAFDCNCNSGNCTCKYQDENTRVLKIYPHGEKYEELCQAVL